MYADSWGSTSSFQLDIAFSSGYVDAMETTTINSKPQQITNIWPLHIPDAHLLSEDRFAEIQIQWLCKLVEQELSWQIILILLEKIRAGANLDFVLERIKKLKESGLIINEQLLENIKVKYQSDCNVWREPELFHVNTQDFEKLHLEIKRLEETFKLEANHRYLFLSMPEPRAQFRRATIAKKSHNALISIRERYRAQYGGDAGFEKFRAFVVEKIVANPSLHRFLFRGKDTENDDGDKDDDDKYEQFKTISNTRERKARKKRELRPFFQSLKPQFQKMRGVIMPPTKKNN